MVKKPFRGNYLELKVRVSYDERTDTVHLTSKDKDLPTNRGFHLTLNGGRDAEYTLRSLLEKEGLIPEDKFRAIPENLQFSDAINTDQWDKFPLGLLANGEEAVWNASLSSNLLIAGRSGSGKSVIQRNIIFHCLRHPENWELYGIDLLRVEMTPYMKYGQPLEEVATTVPEAFAIVTKAHTELNKRYRSMEQTGVTYFRYLPDVPPAWMIMIDESFFLLATTGIKTDEGRAEDALREELKHLLSDIARLGRAAGIYLVLSTQRVDSKVFTKTFKEEFRTRIAASGMDEIASTLLLDNNKATHLNRAIKGRGYFQENGKGSDFQGYFSTFDWPYESGLISK